MPANTNFVIHAGHDAVDYRFAGRRGHQPVLLVALLNLSLLGADPRYPGCKATAALVCNTLAPSEGII